MSGARALKAARKSDPIADLEERLADWRQSLDDDVPKARGLLKNLLVGRIEMEPDRERGRYRFRATGTLVPLISGIMPRLVVPQSVASPTGFEPVFWP